MQSNQPNNRPAPRKKRKMTRAAKAAYTRAAVIGVLAIAVLGGGIYGISRLVGHSDPDESGSSSSQTVVQVDAIGSSSIKVLSGDELGTMLDERITKLSTSASTPSGEADTTPGGGTEGGQQTPVTPTPTIPDTFDPSTVGTSGYGNISSWKAINSDVVGWLKIPNTNINYPVVVGPDNLYYNSLGYYKEYSRNGVIWADSYTKFGNSSQISQNTVLYGHNWTNVSANPRIGNSNDVMFAQLTAFHHLNFAKVTPYIHYSTSSEEMLWKVFAVFYTEESFNYIESDPGAAGLQYIIDEAKLRSRHNYSVDVNSSDKILTLSTCTRAYGQTSKQRFVVMARLMRPGETVTEVNIVSNPNPKQPNL